MVLQMGSGGGPPTIPFYESCGFRRIHQVRSRKVWGANL